jgi:hypothetical protein
VPIYCRYRRKFFPHNTSSSKDPKIMKRMPEKSTKGTMVIKRAEKDNNGNDGETSIN